MTEQIDWNAPLEATSNNGRDWNEMRIESVSGKGAHCISDDGWGGTFNDDGSNAWGNEKFRIRNRKPAQPRIAPEVVERMVALTRWLAETGLGSKPDEAREILAQIEPPVDPLELEAREIVATADVMRTPNQVEAIRQGKAGGRQTDMVLRGIKRGLELAKRTDAESE